MAKIGKNSSQPEGNANVSIETLKAEYQKTIATIRQILGKNQDASQMAMEDKNKLRGLYSQAASLANALADRITDEKQSEELREQSKKLRASAVKYGSTAKTISPRTTFDDVKGLEHVKRLVKSFMFLAQNPDILKTYKLEGGLGMLMYGAPGTGKTMFAEAIANEMKLPLFIVTPADIFKSYVGESEQAVKLLFQELDYCTEGAILFVDECESIFSKRGQDTKDYKAAVTTELLQRINGFGVNGAKRIMIAATNRPDVIDPAYLRYKRFSHIIHVTPPDAEAMRAIVSSKLNGLPLDPSVTVDEVMALVKANTTTIVGSDLDPVESATGYYSAADICGIIEEACRFAIELMEEKKSSTPEKITLDMFKKAFAKTKPSISPKLIKELDEFRENMDK